MKRAKRKLNRRSGFTLAETLVAILILVMVAGVVAAGIPVAGEAYMKVVDSANAQVLLSTTVAALRDELATATDVTSTGSVLTYRADSGALSRLSLNEEGILLEEYVDVSDPGAVPSRQLVSQKAAADRLYAQWEEVTCINGVVTVKGLAVKKAGSDTVLAALETLKIRVLRQN